MGTALPLALHDPGRDAEGAHEAQRPGREERRPHDEVVVRRHERQHGPGGALGGVPGRARDHERRREDERRPHPLVAERALVVLEVDLGAEGRRRQSRRHGEELLHAAVADVLQEPREHQAAHRSASARFSSRPLPAREKSGRRAPPAGERTPSNSIDSMRTWSWKYSRCRRRSTPHSACAESCGAQWPETSRPCADASPFTRRRPVMPPQRVTSACRQSTQPTRLRKSARTYAYSPAATSSVACSRTSLRPSKSADETGSSNQRTFQSETYRLAQRTASFAGKAPFASTYSSASPIAARTTSSRCGSRSGSRPSFIFTRGMPSPTQPPSWSRRRSSEYEQNPPLP